MLEQAVRRNAPVGRGFAGRANFRRYGQKLARPVLSAAPYPNEAYEGPEGYDDEYEEDMVMAGNRMHSSRHPRRHDPYYRRQYHGYADDEDDEGDDGEDYYDSRMGYYEDEGQMMQGEMMMGDEYPVDQQPPIGEELQESAEIPMRWSTSYFPFRKEVSLDAASKANQIEIPLTFNKAANAVAESGAYLGNVGVTDLSHNGPVSFAVRAECKPGPTGSSDIQLNLPKENLPAVGDSVHAVLDKPRSGVDGRKSFAVRDVGAVYDTWLSRFPGWSAKNLQNNISPIKDSADVALSVNHPIAHYLHSMGHINLDEIPESDSTLVDAGLVAEARAELETQEANNPSFGDAQRLRLVLVRAYGKPTAAGAPAMRDPTEVVDTYIKEKRTQADVNSRLKAPIVISGKWAVSHGRPLTEEEEEEVANTGTLADLSADESLSV